MQSVNRSDDDPCQLPRTGLHYYAARGLGGWFAYRMLNGVLHRFLAQYPTERDARAAVARLCAMHGMKDTYEGVEGGGT